MKKKLWLIVAVMMLFSVFAVPATASAATVKLNKKSVSIEVKEKCTLKVKGTTQKVKWSSSNKKIATVTSKGVVKGIKKGKCKITAKVGKKKLVCKVTVKKPAVKSIQLSETSLTMKEGAQKKLTVKYTPSNAVTGKKITWTSENPDVATVSSTGVVTAKEAGYTYIRAKTANGKQNSCFVTVEADLVEIAITNDNVNEFFEVKEIAEWEENAFGETDRIWISYGVCLKDKYADRVVQNGKGSTIAIEYEWENKEFDWIIDFDNMSYSFVESDEITPEYEDTSKIESCDGYLGKRGNYWTLSSGYNSKGVSKENYSDGVPVTRRVNAVITRAEGTLVLKK